MAVGATSNPMSLISPSSSMKPIPSQFFPYPASISGLTPAIDGGLKALSIVSTLSAFSTFSLLCFLTYRMIFWRKYYNSTIIYNQNIILLFNLLLGDFIQAIGFMISYHWMRLDGIFAPSPACSAQGVLTNMGDLLSGSFVLLISLHTATTVIWGQIVPWRFLIAAVSFCWVFSIVMSNLGWAIYGREYFTAAGIWCWARQKHEAARLWSHYIWIFTFEFGTLLVYATVFINLRRRTAKARNNQNNSGKGSVHSRVNRATWFMILYPLVYFLFTAPLAIGRMYSIGTGKTNPTWYYAFAGCFLISSGWIDCLIYALTRRVFVKDHNGGSTMPLSNMQSSVAGSRALSAMRKNPQGDDERLIDGQKPLPNLPSAV